MVQELSTDRYVPMTGSLDFKASLEQALAYIDRQHHRLTSGAGFSFCVADAQTDEPLGQAGLWLRELAAGRASAGYAIAPSARGRRRGAEALAAITTFGWSLDRLHRIELYIEPWNLASQRTAERAGYQREGLLRRHREIGVAASTCSCTQRPGRNAHETLINKLGSCRRREGLRRGSGPGLYWEVGVW
jgi:RimJ/RimL family protein N-acetyltransferase